MNNEKIIEIENKIKSLQERIASLEQINKKINHKKKRKMIISLILGILIIINSYLSIKNIYVQIDRYL